MHRNNNSSSIIKGESSSSSSSSSNSSRTRTLFFCVFGLFVSSSICRRSKWCSSSVHSSGIHAFQRQRPRRRRGSSSSSTAPPSTAARAVVSKRSMTTDESTSSHTCLFCGSGSVVVGGNTNASSSERTTRTTTMRVVGQPNYSLGGGSIDLSKRWIDLVSEGHVRAVVELPTTGGEDDDDQDNCQRVAYGVRMVRQQQQDSENDTTELYKCEEYVIAVGGDDENDSSSSSSEPHPLISSINATLSSRRQNSGGGGSIFKWSTTTSSSGGANGKGRPSPSFVAQLQLVRTLRPPPSEGFVGAATSNVPPTYDHETDSFVTGPLRLQLRPRAAKVCTVTDEMGDNDEGNKLCTPWDVYHNVSPADTRGHFLLVPALEGGATDNLRGQVFTAQDAHDLVWIARSVEPAGSLVVGYNSVGAGASQNHIHCHAWPCPPVPLLPENRRRRRRDHDHERDGSSKNDGDDDDDDGENDGDTTTNGWNAYPVSKVKEIYDFYDIDDGAVEVSFLEYPVFCLLLSAPTAHLDLLAKAVSTCLDSIGDSPYNIAFLNRKQNVEYETGVEKLFDGGDENNDNKETETEDEETADFVDVYLFARSKERSDHVPEHKLGVSEMMGVFHAQSEDQLERWASDVVAATTAAEQEVDTGGFDEEEENENDDDDHHHHHGHFDSKGVMYQSLLDVSIENEWEIWETIKTKLSLLLS